MSRLFSFPAARFASDRSSNLMIHIAVSCLVALAAVYLLYTIAPERLLDHDLFHEMAAFRDCLQRGYVPETDSFAYTPTVVPLVHHELGSGAVFFLFFKTMGLPGLMLVRLLLTAAIVFCVALRARLAGATWTTFSILSFIGIGMGFVGFGTVRAQLFTFLFAGIELLMLRPRPDPGQNRVVPSPYFLVPWLLWLNLHAGFVAGAGIYLAAWLEAIVRERRWSWRWFGIALAMAIAVCINPYGLEYPRYLVRAVTMARPSITEWRPIWTFAYSYQLTYVVSLLVLIYALVRTGVARMPGILVVLVVAVEAALHLKHMTLYAIVWMGSVPAWIEGTLPSRAADHVVRRVPMAVLFVAVACMVFMTVDMVKQQVWRILVPASREAVLSGHPLVYPVGAVSWLEQQHYSGNVMTPFRAGAFVSWCLAPAVKVSLDGRYEVAYQPGVFEQIEGFYRGAPGWLETLKRYPTHLVLARVTDAVVPLLEREAGWHRVYDDGAFLLLAPATDRQRSPGGLHRGTP